VDYLNVDNPSVSVSTVEVNIRPVCERVTVFDTITPPPVVTGRNVIVEVADTAANSDADVRVPVAPADAAGLDDVSTVTVGAPAVAAESTSSVLPDGAVNEVFVASPFTPMTNRFAR
jgi:hypothetical protein